MRVLLVGLAHGLRSAGHPPVLAAPANFGRWIEAMGFPFIAAGPDLEVMLETERFTGPSAHRFFSATVRAQFGPAPGRAARRASASIGARGGSQAARPSAGQARRLALPACQHSRDGLACSGVAKDR